MVFYYGKLLEDYTLWGWDSTRQISTWFLRKMNKNVQEIAQSSFDNWEQFR